MRLLSLAFDLAFDDVISLNRVLVVEASCHRCPIFEGSEDAIRLHPRHLDCDFVHRSASDDFVKVVDCLFKAA